jgi:hypothetical protein
LAAAPTAPAETNSAAALTAPALGSGYAVQVTSKRTERGLKLRFGRCKRITPNQLSGRRPIIRRDLGAAGIY